MPKTFLWTKFEMNVFLVSILIAIGAISAVGIYYVRYSVTPYASATSPTPTPIPTSAIRYYLGDEIFRYGSAIQTEIFYFAGIVKTGYGDVLHIGYAKPVAYISTDMQFRISPKDTIFFKYGWQYEVTNYGSSWIDLQRVK